MATTINTLLYSTNNTDQQFRNWCNFINNVFLLGFVNNGDTGQINLATVTKPTATQQVKGYTVYRSNDALTPFYVLVEFGSGSNINFPAIWVTIGMGTDGTGVINNKVLFSRTQITPGQSDLNTQHLSFGSADTNRVCYAMFLNTTAAAMWLSIERRKDSNINDADTGIIVDWGGLGSKSNSQCCPFVGITPKAENGMQFILSTNNPAAYGNVIPQGLRIPQLGISEPPGLNVAICNQNDFSDNAEITITINGTDHTFKQCGSNINSLRGSATTNFDVATRLLLRYE